MKIKCHNEEVGIQLWFGFCSSSMDAKVCEHEMFHGGLQPVRYSARNVVHLYVYDINHIGKEIQDTKPNYRRRGETVPPPYTTHMAWSALVGVCTSHTRTSSPYHGLSAGIARYPASPSSLTRLEGGSRLPRFDSEVTCRRRRRGSLRRPLFGENADCWRPLDRGTLHTKWLQGAHSPTREHDSLRLGGLDGEGPGPKVGQQAPQREGILMSGNEVSQVFLSLAMSYHGGRGNRPLWISWGVTFSAISCFILALPHLVYGPGKDAIALTEEFLDTTVLNSSIPKTNDRALLCSGNRTASAYCQEDVSGGEHSLMPLILIFFSQFVLGIGTTLFHSLGQTYLDDHTKKTNAPLLLEKVSPHLRRRRVEINFRKNPLSTTDHDYNLDLPVIGSIVYCENNALDHAAKEVGMVLSLRMLGPAAGFAFSSFCLSLYIDPTLTPVIKPTDPRWLGAWWLGWLVLGALMIVFAFLISWFPRELPPKKKKRSLNKIEKNKDTLIKSSNKTSNNKLSSESEPLNKGAVTESLNKIPIKIKKQEDDEGSASVFAMIFGFLGSGYFIGRFKPRPRLVLGWNVILGAVHDKGVYGLDPVTGKYQHCFDIAGNRSCVKGTPELSRIRMADYIGSGDRKQSQSEGPRLWGPPGFVTYFPASVGPPGFITYFPASVGPPGFITYFPASVGPPGFITYFPASVGPPGFITYFPASVGPPGFITYFPASVGPPGFITYFPASVGTSWFSYILPSVCGALLVLSHTSQRLWALLV
uniref:(California timema) hypothetical protein n=1 Tax=Timema californicum TaxID=61474 RepID=A0A7R9J9S1_TIMCA|nr:unnamed protein product [Timema californicum]